MTSYTPHIASAAPAQSGQALTDYALVIFLVAIGCAVLLGPIGQSVLTMFTSVLPGF